MISAQDSDNYQEAPIAYALKNGLEGRLPIVKMIELLTTALAQGMTQIKVDCWIEYDIPAWSLTLLRPETTAEIARRKMEEDRAMWAAEERKRQNERAEYERLRAIYGDGGGH